VFSGPTAVSLQLNDIKLTTSAAEGEIVAQKKLLVTGATGATGGYAVGRPATSAREFVARHAASSAP
jgi:hypothetical protein